MKNKIIALLISAVLLALCPLSVLAAATPGQEIAALQSDLREENTGRGTLARLSANLLRSLTGKLENAEILPEDIATAADKAAEFLADATANLGSSTSRMLGVGSSGNHRAAAGHFAIPAVQNTGSVTLKTLSKEISRYLFIRVDNPEDVAALIAASCDFDYAVLSDGHGTIYIRVDIENNPEIFNYAVFRNLVEDLYEQQGIELRKNTNGSADYLMSYEHIAGELALHAIVYAAAGEIIRLTGTKNARLLSLYDSAKEAALNVDENRLSPQLIALFGRILMNTVTYRIMSAFGLI